ncbi:hypothetical protein [Streptomyces sp. FIT100]|uniref:hypothetical protein n=1 Tax=Streptomyces sp. FIT100 TaxID=2837956 RepID=UPI0021C9A98C|nr:hypothetical protein [Streptomyces sp. FIT100]
MAGLPAIGGDLNAWSSEELAKATGLDAAYKSVRQLVQYGALHRLGEPNGEPGGEEPAVVQYTAPDAGETLLPAWRSADRHGSPRFPVRPGASGRTGPGRALPRHPHRDGAPRRGSGGIRPHAESAGG